jgi:hypothetical protein
MTLPAGAPRTYITIPLPAGDWAVSAHVFFGSEVNAQYQTGVLCEIADAANSFGDANVDRGTSATLVTTAHVVTGKELTLGCQNENPYPVDVFMTSLVAIQVSSLTYGSLPYTDFTKGPVLHPPHPSPAIGHLEAPAAVPSLKLSPGAHARLVRAYYSANSSPAERQRAQIALLAAEGKTVDEIASETFASNRLVRVVIAANDGQVLAATLP